MPAADPLALAVTQLPGWRWRAGMHDSKGRIVLRVRARDGRPVVRSALGGEPDGSDWDDDLPDLDDDATGGCLLAMLPPDVTADRDTAREPARRWRVIAWHTPEAVNAFRAVTYGPTLGRACAEALCAIGRCA